jgi:hypothetical protein
MARPVDPKVAKARANLATAIRLNRDVEGRRQEFRTARLEQQIRDALATEPPMPLRDRQHLAALFLMPEGSL